jgi:hypothetical protein
MQGRMRHMRARIQAVGGAECAKRPVCVCECECECECVCERERLSEVLSAQRGRRTTSFLGGAYGTGGY